MRHRPTPTVATSLLKMFCSSAEYDAATGDLLEQYQLGRSRFWYWRQVFGIVFFGLYGKAVRQGFALIFLLGAVLAVATCVWTVLMILDIGGVFATIVRFRHDVSRSAPWLGLMFLLVEVGATVFYFRADGKRKSLDRENQTGDR